MNGWSPAHGNGTKVSRGKQLGGEGSGLDHHNRICEDPRNLVQAQTIRAGGSERARKVVYMHRPEDVTVVRFFFRGRVPCRWREGVRPSGYLLQPCLRDQSGPLYDFYSARKAR